jgi:hypothetical protein
VFQLLHLHTEGGLGDEAMAGSSGKVPVGVDGNNIFQLYEGHLID